MYYLIGDIHGCMDNLEILFGKIVHEITDDDTIIFMGDYIDRGPSSYEVVEFLMGLLKKFNVIFLKGNHEDMLLKLKKGENDSRNYFENGGIPTLRSYRKHTGRSGIPRKHQSFFSKLLPYYETIDFIAVHAGLNPKINTIDEQEEYDMLWIRENFFRSERRWEKTVIFGHTPCSSINGSSNDIYINDETNIIGIDTGACYGGILTCFRWPDRAIFQG
jgi:serine/threonine protein phosphatase 1